MTLKTKGLCGQKLVSDLTQRGLSLPLQNVSDSARDTSDETLLVELSPAELEEYFANLIALVEYEGPEM